MRPTTRVRSSALRPPLARLAVATASALAALAAHDAAQAATLTTKHDSSNCWTAGWPDGMHDEETFFTRDTVTAKTIKNNTATGTYNIYCPIVKRTSGPGNTNDALTTISIPVTSPSNTTVSCHVDTWKSWTVDGNTSNRVQTTTPVSRSSSGTLTLTMPAGSPSSYWTAGGQTTQPRWYYSELVCSVGAGATVGRYDVTENGTEQVGYTIAPITNCPLEKPEDPTNGIKWRVETDANGPSGWVNAQASDANRTKFSLTCKDRTGANSLPNMSIIDVAMVHPNNGSEAGCNFNTTSNSSFTWYASQSGNEFVSDVLPGSYQPRIVVPLTQSYTMSCEQSLYNGDGKWMSYRVQPYPNRGAWTGSASVSGSGDVPANALDGNAGTRWSTGKNATAGMTYTVNFGASIPFNEITLDSGSSANDYPRNFTVSLSYDGVNFQPITSFTGTGPFVDAQFSEQFAQYVRITLDSGFSHYWSIRELNAFDRSGSLP